MSYFYFTANIKLISLHLFNVSIRHDGFYRIEIKAICKTESQHSYYDKVVSFYKKKEKKVIYI